MASPTVLHLRSEQKPLEHRSCLTPTTAKALIEAGYQVEVEKSPTDPSRRRIFADEEFESIGAKLVEDQSWTSAPVEYALTLADGADKQAYNRGAQRTRPRHLSSQARSRPVCTLLQATGWLARCARSFSTWRWNAARPRIPCGRCRQEGCRLWISRGICCKSLRLKLKANGVGVGVGTEDVGASAGTRRHASAGGRDIYKRPWLLPE
jgi:Alanine dehydrogenase/PNT, N-terminal domain